MNISQEKTGNVSVKLTVAIEENDYKDKVVKELKEEGYFFWCFLKGSWQISFHKS